MLSVFQRSFLAEKLAEMSKGGTAKDISHAIGMSVPNTIDIVDDEEEVFEGSESDSAADETPAGGGDDFMQTDDFRRLFRWFRYG